MAQLPSGEIALDASFVIALVGSVRPAQRFTSVLSRGVLFAPTLGEVVYKLRQRSNVPPSATARFLQSLGTRVDVLAPRAALLFADFKALDALSTAAQQAAGVSNPKSLSFADICCLAAAQDAGLPVLTGDTQWTTLAAYGLSVAVFDFRDPTLTS